MKKENDEELLIKELIGEDFSEYEHLTENNFEHGGGDVLEEAILSLATALNKAPDEIKKLIEKGGKFDELSKKFGETKGDTEVFEKLAELRGVSKDEMKEEILWALNKATTEKEIDEIMAENPGMNRKTAEELVRLRLEMKKSEKKPSDDGKNKTMLTELENFLAKHSSDKIEKLAKNVVEEWEGGIPLETAFEKHRLSKENKRLFSEIDKLKNEKTKESQKNYARVYSTGSATSAAGTFGTDEFIEELFKEY